MNEKVHEQGAGSTDEGSPPSGADTVSGGAGEGEPEVYGPIGFDPNRLPVKVEPGSVEEVTRNLAKFKKLNEIVPMLTEWRDWIAYPAGPFGERAWPTRYACERVAGAAGISIRKDLDQMQGRPYIKRWEDDDRGRFYIVEIHAYAELAGHHKLPVVGMASSRDPFFGQKGSDSEGNPIYKALSEIKESDLVKKAFTDLMRQAIHRLLGIGNIDATYLDRLYGKAVPRVMFKSGQAAPQSAEEFEADQKSRKRLWAICLAVRNDNEKDASALLADLTTFKGDKGQVPGVKDVAKLKGRRLGIALQTAEKRLEEWYKNHADQKAATEAAIARHAA